MRATCILLSECIVFDISGARSVGVDTWLGEVYGCSLSDPLLHRLATATALVEEMRAAVYDRTGFRCSAGIAHNKVIKNNFYKLFATMQATYVTKSEPNNQAGFVGEPMKDVRLTKPYVISYVYLQPEDSGLQNSVALKVTLPLTSKPLNLAPLADIDTRVESYLTTTSE